MFLCETDSDFIQDFLFRMYLHRLKSQTTETRERKGSFESDVEGGICKVFKYHTFISQENQIIALVSQ